MLNAHQMRQLQTLGSDELSEVVFECRNNIQLGNKMNKVIKEKKNPELN